MLGGRSLNFSWISLTVLFNIVRHMPVRIIHLHWQHAFFLGDGKFRMRVKSILSLLQFYFVKLIGIKIVWTLHNLHNHENRYKDIELRCSRHLASARDAGRPGRLLRSRGIELDVDEVADLKQLLGLLPACPGENTVRLLRQTALGRRVETALAGVPTHPGAAPRETAR